MQRGGFPSVGKKPGSKRPEPGKGFVAKKTKKGKAGGKKKGPRKGVKGSSCGQRTNPSWTLAKKKKRRGKGWRNKNVGGRKPRERGKKSRTKLHHSKGGGKGPQGRVFVQRWY